MPDKITGALEVGTNDRGEVVINHPDFQPDENGVGHIVFSPDQARNLARLLLKHADEAEGGSICVGDVVEHRGDGWQATVEKIEEHESSVSGLAKLAFFVEGGFWRLSELRKKATA